MTPSDQQALRERFYEKFGYRGKSEHFLLTEAPSEEIADWWLAELTRLLEGKRNVLKKMIKEMHHHKYENEICRQCEMNEDIKETLALLTPQDEVLGGPKA